MTPAEQALSDQIDALVASTAKLDTVAASAVTALQGIPALIQAAVDASLAAGDTTATQLAAKVTAALSDISARSDEIAAAIPANTPAAP